MARKINTRNGKFQNFVYTAPTAKHGKAYDFIDSDIRRKTLQYFDDIDATSFGFQEFLNV